MQGILDSGLSEASKSTYWSNLRSLARAMGHLDPQQERHTGSPGSAADLRATRAAVSRTLAEDPEEVWRVVDGVRAHNPRTAAAWLAAVMSALRYAYERELPPPLRDARALRTRREEYSAIMRERLKPEIAEQALRNRPTVGQTDKEFTLAELRAAMQRLPAGSQERLAFAMYTLMIPQRADFGCCRVYRVELSNRCAAAPGTRVNSRGDLVCTMRELREAFSEEVANDEGNYVLLVHDRGAKLDRARKPVAAYLVMQEYKTARTLGPRVISLSPALVDEIEAALASRPMSQAGYLFVSRKTGRPYHKSNSFVCFLRRATRAAVGVPVGPTMFRHATASALPWAQMTGEDTRRIADMFGHTPSQLMAYRHVPERDPDAPAPEDLALAP